ncbi:Protein RecA [Bienertia sinuspersici]
MRKPLGVGSQQGMGLYLGCPMDVDGRNTSCLNNIHERIVNNISSWSYSCLSAVGRGILINSETWAGNSPLKLKSSAPSDRIETPKYVEDLMRGRSWNTTKIWQWFNKVDDQRILSTYIPRQGKEDETIWLPKENGDYSVKSGYWYLQNGGYAKHQVESFWKLLWKTQMIKDDNYQVWPNLVATTWAIWIHRNSIIFTKEKLDPQVILNVAQIEVDRWYKGFWESTGTTRTSSQPITREEEVTSWEWGTTNQEETNILKIDGAWKKSRNGEVQAAYGWVMTQGSRCIQEEANRVFADSPLQAEAHALLDGSGKATKHWSRIAVWTDSARLVQLLHNPNRAPASCYFLIMDILNILKTFSACKVYKVNRDRIKKAHDLAIQAR